MSLKKTSSLNKIIKLMGDKSNDIDIKKPAISVHGYTKKFKSFISTNDVSFDVNHGSIHGFIGPNGSGKTTTIKALIGAYIPTSGDISINGHKAGSVAANKFIGYIPERASFPKHLNAIEYLSAMAEISGVSYKDAKKRALDILEALGLSSQKNRKPITFSSGMQKKILLAQSLMTNPSILILDEPAANLDPSSRKELFDELIELKEKGKTIFISSHILAELERIVDDITFIYYGEVLYSGTVEKFVEDGESVFIKTTNNKNLVKMLEKEKYKFIGDLDNEIEIKDISKLKAKKLFEKLAKHDFNVVSFRTNDLQTAYEKLALKANNKKSISQTTIKRTYFKKKQNKEGKK